MAMYSAKRKTRAPARPRKRQMTRRRPITRMSRSLYQRPVHRFRRHATVQVVTGNAVYSPYQDAKVFTLSEVTGVGDFTSLYDQYRIDYVVQKFYLRIDPSAQAAASSFFPALYWARDYDSSAILSQDEMRERANMKTAILRPDRPITIKYKPNLLREVWANSTTTTYEPVWGKWIDIAVTNARHFGHCWNINNFTNTNYRLEIETCYYFSCKSVR